MIGGCYHLDDPVSGGGPGEVEFAIWMAKLSQCCCSLPDTLVVGAPHSRRRLGHTIYTGMPDLCPNIVVDQSTLVTSLKIRGRNHILSKSNQGPYHLLQCNLNPVYIPMKSSVVLSLCDFVICSRRIVCPRLLGHHLPRHRLHADIGESYMRRESMCIHAPRSHAGSESPKAADVLQYVRALPARPRLAGRPRRNPARCSDQWVQGCGLMSLSFSRKQIME